MNRRLFAPALIAAASLASFSAHAQTEVIWWHSMPGALGEWVNDQAKEIGRASCRERV